MPEALSQAPLAPSRSTMASLILRPRSEELPAFACLRAPLRGQLEASLTRGAGLGLLWVNLAAFPLFARLYGEQLAGEVALAVEGLLRQITPQLLNPQRLQIIERVDPSSFMILFANGHRWMARITAMGCAGAALVAACLAVEDDAWLAALAGHVVLGVAAERAAVVSSGPGSLAVAILDTLSDLDSKDLHERAKVE